MKVGILTTTEKNSLDGQLVQPDWYFNPVLDCNTDWVISTQEIDGSIYSQNEWVKTLPLIDWCAPIQPPTPTGSTENYVGS
jgi:hypothetical protein